MSLFLKFVVLKSTRLSNFLFKTHLQLQSLLSSYKLRKTLVFCVILIYSSNSCLQRAHICFYFHITQRAFLFNLNLKILMNYHKTNNPSLFLLFYKTSDFSLLSLCTLGLNPSFVAGLFERANGKVHERNSGMAFNLLLNCYFDSDIIRLLYLNNVYIYCVYL